VTAGATVLDVGACFGYYSLLAAQAVGKSGKVYAFEPTPDNYATLLRNIALNGWEDTIVPVPKAVSSHRGDMALHLSKFRENNSLGDAPLFTTTRALPVEVVAIDEFLDDERVSVIKMDIEGYEPYGLDGMQQTIRRSKDLTLFTELNVHCLEGAGVKPEAFLEQLDNLGFDVQLIDDEERELLPVTTANLGKAAAHPSRFSNLLCVQRRHR
jgi:FkbM family methyltransferase